jgi:sorbitol/mannitol transport system substrate-binding protein
MRNEVKVKARSILRRLAGCTAATGLVFTAGCAGAGSFASGGDTVSIAMVSNSQMTDAVSLSSQFEEENPGVKLKFITLPENQARAKTTLSTATGSDQFDVVMVSNYETPQWAANGWLTNLGPYMAKTPGYDENDFIPSLRDVLSHDGNMYSVPFYGESSFLMYRKDLFDQAGITVPEHPTWQQVGEWAKKFDAAGNGMTGICLRGKPGWGEVLAPLDTVINTFGGRWFDDQWNAQLTSPEVEKAVQFYVDTVREYGEPGAAASGFQECATQFTQGKTAMWYDATSAVNTVEDTKTSTVAGKVGYAFAPVEKTDYSGWLYTWSLGIPAASKHKDNAWKFISWMTDKKYLRMVGEKLGWERVPPGSRESTYQIPQYAEISKAYGQLTLDSIAHTNSAHPTVQPVPYTGVQFLAIPEFQDLGTRVSQQISAAIAGQKSVADALKQSQEYAEVVGKSYQENS